MRVAILQSNYIPWRGVFDMINSVDVFIFHDDIQYTKQDWRNRNKIKFPHGTEWITVPVKKVHVDTPIDEIEISGKDWIEHHHGMIFSSLRGAPFYADIVPLFTDVHKHDLLYTLNQDLIRRVCFYLGIKTQLVNARTLGTTGKKTEKILDLCQKFGATTYLSGPAARQYLDVDLLASHDIAVQWKEYKYGKYQQQYGGFDGAVTVLDLIANIGPEAKNHITSVAE